MRPLAALVFLALAAVATTSACSPAPSAENTAFACSGAADCVDGWSCAGAPLRCVAPGDDAGLGEDEDAGRDDDGGQIDDDGGGAQDAGAGGPDAAAGTDAGADAGTAPDAGTGADAGPIVVVDGGCSGHDEDGDTVPDGCDVCPEVFDPLQEDVFEVMNDDVADGVGDACDPHPDATGDARIFFDGFEAPSLGPAWHVRAGDPEVIGDALVFTTAVHHFADLAPLAASEVFVATSARFTAIQGSNAARACVVFRGGTDGDGLACCLTRRADGANQGVDMAKIEANGQDITGLGSSSTAVDLDQDVHFAGAGSGASTLACTIGDAESSLNNTGYGDKFGVHVHNATASFAYLAVYTHP